MKRSRSEVLKSMDRIDVMVDIETLGTKSDSTVIQIAAMAFDVLTGEVIKEFNHHADIEMNKQLTVDGSTLKWWLDTDPELLKDLLNSGNQSSKSLILLFRKWLLELIALDTDKEVYLWGNGILFDNKMLQHQMEMAGEDYPIHYQNDRDVRTIVDLTSTKLGITEYELKDSYTDESLRHHDAFDDVKYQINVVHSCYNILTQGGK